MKPITIVGGGLAGLTLGIGLRARGVPVVVVEAGRYPRHRVCGEFISGRGGRVLEELQVYERLAPDAFRHAHDVAFFSERTLVGTRDLPKPAWCVSRYVLDARLAEIFQEAGGVLRTNQRWEGTTAGEGRVDATGRRARPMESGWRWFGVKGHARGVALEAGLEMHVATDGYVGLCRVADDVVNVCGLFRRRNADASRGGSLNWLRGAAGSPLFDRLENAAFEPSSLCAVGGLSLRPPPVAPGECRIGDAFTMIPPITGNGMSMALESAECAVEPLARYAEGMWDWESATRAISHQLQENFTPRLRWAGGFHRVLFSDWGKPAMRLLFQFDPAWRAAFASTR